MMPIVFWASFIPWPNENAAAETSWTLRNPRSRGSGRVRGGGRKGPPPRREIPHDRPHERRENEKGIHDGRIHDILADRLGDACLEGECRHEIETSGPRDRL